MFFWEQIQIVVEKKFLGATSIFCCRREQNASHAISIYWNYMIGNFLTKTLTFLLGTIHWLWRQNKEKVLWKFDDIILSKCTISSFS